jgi:hypothetical protein
MAHVTAESERREGDGASTARDAAGPKVPAAIVATSALSTTARAGITRSTA